MPFDEVARALIAAGARLDSRDIAGYTPLSICAGYISTERSLEVGAALCDAGADANAVTRFGEGLLVPCVMVCTNSAVSRCLQYSFCLNSMVVLCGAVQGH